MATHNYTVSHEHSSDATFRAWGGALSNALMSCADLTQTGDSGQINWTTVTRPAQGVVGGYEMYRFNDAIQAETPVFIKIEYGTSTGASNRPGIWFTIGSGSDGSGIITGTNRMFSSVISHGGVASTLTVNSYVSCSPGRLDLGLHVSTALNSGLGISICRLRDANGDMTNEGVDYIKVDPQTKGNITIPREGYGGAFPPTLPAHPMCAAPNTGTGSYGGNVGVYPVYPWIGVPGNPTGAIVCFGADFTANTTMDLDLYGITRNYVAVTNTSGNNGVNGNSSYIGLLLPNY